MNTSRRTHKERVYARTESIKAYARSHALARKCACMHACMHTYVNMFAVSETNTQTDSQAGRQTYVFAYNYVDMQHVIMPIFRCVQTCMGTHACTYTRANYVMCVDAASTSWEQAVIVPPWCCISCALLMYLYFPANKTLFVCREL